MYCQLPRYENVTRRKFLKCQCTCVPDTSTGKRNSPCHNDLREIDDELLASWNRESF